MRAAIFRVGQISVDSVPTPGQVPVETLCRGTRDACPHAAKLTRRFGAHPVRASAASDSAGTVPRQCFEDQTR